MNDLRQALLKTILRYEPAEGYNQTPVPGVYCTKISKEEKRSKKRWRACFGFVVQGCKEIILGRDVHRCEPLSFTATPLQLPVISRVIEVTPEKPFIALLIELDPKTLSEVASQIDDESNESDNALRALFAGKADEKMLEAVLRLAKLFNSAKEAKVLGPLIVKEILYYLLTGPEGQAIRQFVKSESKMHKISQAIHQINSELEQEVDVAALANMANMSRSAFFRNFKEVTAMSPIQYQKRLRLLEAKRLIVENGETAESSAFLVGYKSTSQFSREYSRMFGKSPIRDAAKIKSV